jgi:hypothetical protein
VLFRSIYISYQSTALVSTQVFRDPSAWYHIVAAFDSTQATASNRVKIYVNGSQITSWSTATYPSLNDSAPYNSTIVHNIGRYPYPDSYLDGYLTEFNSIDGQGLTPSSFGANSPTTGVWQPKKFAGTYGTNGFYLPFTNNASTSTLGNDFSGNGNNWTTNNISLTAGSTYDSMTDVPTNTSATVANFCTWNPLDSKTAISSANLNSTYQTGLLSAKGTFGVTSGKWYWEVTVIATGGSGQEGIGIGKIDTFPPTGWVGDSTSSWGYWSDGVRWHNSGTSSYGASYTTGDVIGVALDMDAGTLVFYKNNSSQGTAYSSISGTITPVVSNQNTSSSLALNCGQRGFVYTPPSGFVALNTFNLPTPTIGATASTLADDYFNIALYTGNATARTISGLGFQPDFNWTKPRNAVGSHVLTDSVRGVTNFLETNSTGAEQTGSTGIQSWNSDGYALGTGNDWNATGETFVSWNWRASGSTVSNTAGSITSTVSANTSAGFSIVTCTSPSSAGSFTFGHGLGVAPKFIISKSRSGTGNWSNYHVSTGAGGYLLFTTAAYTANTDTWNNTTPTSTLISSTTNWWGTSSNLVFYCFSEVAGYSKFSSYVGNGSADGTFIFTGFKPRWIMVKRSSATSDWFIIDTARNTYNEATTSLFANASNADYTLTTGGFDVVSNGFKLRVGSGFNPNASGETYVYAAFAEHPFKYSLAR